MALAVLAPLELLVLCVFGFAPFAAAFGRENERFLGTHNPRKNSVRGPAELLADFERLDDKIAFAPSDAYSLNARTDRMEDALRPLFKLAPKDPTGRIDAKAARYALHRLFVQRHAWHVNGIELRSTVRNSSRVGEALDSSGSFSLKQLARFAATLETLVHADEMERLRRTFDMLGLSRTMPNSDKLAKQVTEAYMAMFLLSESNPGASNYSWLKGKLETLYHPWADTQLFVEEIRRTIFDRMSEGEPLSLWEACSQVVEEIGERYGRWQNDKICLEMKAKLVAMEIPGTVPGRVPLSVFWSGMLTNPNWLFVESVPYLQQVGAVEGEAPFQYVLIPNYMSSAANCDMISKYYDSCCIDECDALLGEVEARVDAMVAPPHRLAEIVGSIPSATVSAPFEISATLLRRLEEGAAAHYDGLVPLHSRLFAQFLHHIYPRECPYPRLSVNASEHMDEWLEHTVVEKSTVKDYCDAAGSATDNFTQLSEELPWTDENELFMQSSWKRGRGVTALRFAASSMSLALYSLAASLALGGMVVAARAPKSSSVRLSVRV